MPAEGACARCRHAEDRHYFDRWECGVPHCDCRAFMHQMPDGQRPLFSEISMMTTQA